MKKYRFPFDTVRRVCARHRDEQRFRLADAFRAELIVQHQQQRLNCELSNLQNRQREEMSQPELDVDYLLAAHRYELVLKGQRQTLEKQSATLADEVERHRQSVIDAEQCVQVMEKLDGRMRDEHRAKEERAEIELLDETAQQRKASLNGG